SECYLFFECRRLDPKVVLDFALKSGNQRSDPKEPWNFAPSSEKQGWDQDDDFQLTHPPMPSQMAVLMHAK
ncbi:MAG: hypothetical protein WAK55_24360, partial [Xanthobacteraceae bacterium]